LPKEQLQIKLFFTGANDTKGFWNGIRIQSDSVKNLLDHAEVLYAGKTEMPGVAKIASIGLDGDYLANLTIKNSKNRPWPRLWYCLEDSRTSLNSDYDMVNIFEDLSLGNVSLP